MSVVVIGAGGHASVVLDALIALGVDVHGLLDADAARVGEQVLGHPILGGDDLLPLLPGAGVTHYVVGIGSVGNTVPREMASRAAEAAGLQPFTVVHPTAILSPFATLGPGTVVLPGAVVNPNVTTGPHTIINSNATIEHEAALGPFVHIAPGATVLGRVIIQERTHIGAGAVIRQGASIGKDVMVGAGAVVASDLPDEVRAVGVPARFTGGQSELPGR